jgi:hypothetical protein
MMGLMRLVPRRHGIFLDLYLVDCMTNEIIMRSEDLINNVWADGEMQRLAPLVPHSSDFCCYCFSLATCLRLFEGYNPRSSLQP